jgi:glycosyltransferase involved in cell wall biosynthesis
MANSSFEPARMSETEELNVLLVAGRMEIRGSCTYTLRLARRLPDCGIAATLVSSDTQQIDDETRAAIKYQEYRRIDAPLWGCLVRSCLLRDLRERPPALLHIQSPRALALGSWLARRLEKPFVLTVHHHLVPRERLAVDRRLCRRIIAVSRSLRDDLVDRQGFSPELVTVIPAGVDVAPHPDCPIALDPGHVPVIGTAGPLEAVKGLPYFLGAARQLLDVRPELEFLIAGAGPEEANLRRVARELGIIQKVTFVPYLRDFTESLAAMDVFCLPSLQQGLGTIMLEAMALGRPVIATSVGGVSSAVKDGETGLIVPPGDSRALARRTLELLENPARAQAIGAAARQRVSDEFNVNRMALETAELYREICTCPLKSSPLAPN